MNYEVKPNFKVVGKIFGPKIKLYTEALKTLDNTDIQKLENNENIYINIEGTDYEVTSDMVDIRTSSKDGFNVQMENNKFIILNTELTKELVQEGIAREFVSKVQNLRKSNDFEIMDRINIYYSSTQEVDEAIENFKEFIMKETLADKIDKSEEIYETFNINDHDTKIKVERV